MILDAMNTNLFFAFRIKKIFLENNVMEIFLLIPRCIESNMSGNILVGTMIMIEKYIK